MSEAQAASVVLMIRPAACASNPETAASNAFQREAFGLSAPEVQRRALDEFDRFAGMLESAGVRVVVCDDTPAPATPDAVFPNNWVSFHEGGTVVLYPMLAPSRRAEVRRDVIEAVERGTGARWPNVVDLTGLAEGGAFLEGTGSLVLDRPSRVAYACPSPRTTPEGLDAFAEAMGYEVVTFGATDPAGAPVYHTNVVLALGEGFAVACFACVPDEGERAMLRSRLDASGREVVEVSVDQRDAFAGNILAMRSREGGGVIALSARALASLDLAQRRALGRHGRLAAPDLETIETVGGGGARCMLAEVFGVD